MDILDILRKDQDLWNLYTRKEEYNSDLRDKYDRFPYYASSSRNIFEPIVSKYLIEHGYHVEYPEEKSFAVCLTHDVDHISIPFLPKAGLAIREFQQGRFSEFSHSIAEIFSKKELWRNFSDILALEEIYGARSSFYFMVQNPGEQDYTYDIEDCEMIMGEISDRGWGVGLHGGHTSYNDPVDMRGRKQRIEKVLNKKVVGYRNHYLRFRVPSTWEHLCDAGFLYDTTFGYADCVGFRNGMCHPFKPFNLITQHEIDILEFPLTIMDRTIEQFMNLDAPRAWELTKRLIDTVSELHGVITLLWHNNNLQGQKRKFYEKILGYCLEKGAWMTSGEEICLWWQKNV